MKKYIFGLLILSISCTKQEDFTQIIFPQKRHTVVLYMMADNNLHRQAEQNIQAIEKQWKNSFDGNFIVVLDIPSYTPNKRASVFKIQSPKNIEIEPYNPDFQSTEKYQVKRILANIKKQFPSERYTLILWSHATGWLPQNYDLNQFDDVPTKSFGRDKKEEMSIFDLKEAIIDNTFETIIFDACFMASVEVLYELKEKSAYFIASSSEILNTGFPYEKLTPLFFDETKTPIHWAETFFDFYNQKKGVYRSATISVIENRFFESLAMSIRDYYTEKDFSRIINTQKIQKFDRMQLPIFFDFHHFIKNMNGDTQKMKNIETILKKIIIYKASTPSFAKKINIENHSGLTIYIPQSKSPSLLTDYYKKYTWYSFLNSSIDR